ncbi:MAG: DUF2194 domain-containing protein [Flavobacteriaceae bacterium]
MVAFFKSKIYALVVIIFILLCVSCADNEAYKDTFFKDIKAITAKNNTDGKMTVELQKSSKHFLEEAQVIEYVVDYRNKLDISQSKHVKKVCDYTKIPFRVSNILHWNSPNFKIASSVRVINIHNPTLLNDQAVHKLLNFVAQGGSLIISSVVPDKRFSYFYGFKLDATYQDDNVAAGFKLISPLLPNIKGLDIYKSEAHYGYKLENFNERVTPLITASNNPNYGVVLKQNIGKGNVVFFNTEMTIDKYFRGLMFSLYLPSLEGIPYPIANVSTIYLDDFPAPLYNIMKEPIASEFNLTMSNFVEHIWWPDMLKLAQEFDINYTTTITFDYNSKVTPPFIFTEWERIKKGNTTNPLSNYFTKEVLKQNFELALHGFNHVSLTKNEWKNTDYIGTALQTIKKKWNVEGYGDLPSSYIPPSNIIDSIGLEKLKLNMPTVKYMCSNYLGEVTQGSDREFDIDPYNSKLFDCPRITSEYELSNEKLFVKESVYLFTGIWSHFVHPDDVYQIIDKSNIQTSGDYDYRNAKGYGWHKSKDGSMGLYPRFKKLLSQHKSTYPLSKFINAKAGAPLINTWRSEDYYHQNSNKYYTVKKKGGSHLKKHYWFVYVTNDNLNNLETYLTTNELKYYKTSIQKGVLVNVETNTPSLQIPKFKEENDVYVNSQHKVLNEYDSYFKELIASNEDMTRKEIEVNEELILMKNLELLQDQMFSQKIIDTTAWNNYARMNTWLNKKQDVWKKLDSFYTDNETLETAKYSEELSKISWYPREEVKEYWLLEQIKFEPDNVNLLSKYIKFYNTEENSKRIKAYLKRIAEIEGSPSAKNNYIKHILWSNTSDTQALLNTINPSEIYSDIADDIAWYYYEKDDLERAYNWANYTNEIDIVIKLDWLYTLEEYEKLHAVYKTHIELHPEDNKTKVAMAYIHHSLGDFKNAWVVTDEISESFTAKKPLKKMLNNDVKYMPSNMQKELINKHPKVFNITVKDSLIEHIRLKNSNSVSFTGAIASDRSRNTSFERISTMTIKTKFEHSISFTNSDVYALKTSIISTDNVDKELFGLQYKINTPRTNKLQYWSETRIEKDREDKMFVQFGLGASLSKKKSFSSLEYNVFPVKNGVAYNSSIYRNMLGLYYENNLNKAITITGYAEGNYYSDAVSTASLTGKIQYHFIKKSKLAFYPFFESNYSIGSISQPSGYPYWVIDNRLYGGGGIGGQIGNREISKVLFTADAAHFSDDYSGYFTRFNGRLSIRFLKYYIFQTSAEYYIQSEYYSNQFNFGLRYYLK